MTKQVYECPHCGGTILVTSMNCRIFRHAVYKNSGKQVGPHTKNKFIKKLINDDKIIGCGGQFRIVNDVPQKFDEENSDL